MRWARDLLRTAPGPSLAQLGGVYDPVRLAKDRSGSNESLKKLVMKAAVLGAPVLAAVSAPTALAVRTADAAGITLVASAREDGFEVFTHPDRIDGL